VPDGAAVSGHRLFWTEHDPPSGPVVFWRGNGSVDWERRYVPESDGAKWVRAFNRLDAAITHHRRAASNPLGDHEDADTALYKAQHKIVGDLVVTGGEVAGTPTGGDERCCEMGENGEPCIHCLRASLEDVCGRVGHVHITGNAAQIAGLHEALLRAHRILGPPA
jgi:hypothetical protein